MITRSDPPRPARFARSFLRWLTVLTAIGLLAGVASAQDIAHPNPASEPATDSVAEAAPPMHQPPADIACVNRPSVRISYATTENSAPASSAEVWYTLDRGGRWLEVTQPVLHDGAITFGVPQDGLYGFFVVLQNAGGASSPPPTPGMKPQQWMKVDQTAPLVQVLQVRPDPQFALNRELTIRWTSDDESLGDRPVSIHYRTPQTKAYRLLAEQLPPNGIQNWVVPDHLSGRLDLKITATDKAGNTGVCTCDWLRLAANGIVDTRPRHSRAVTAGNIDPVPGVPTPENRIRTAKRDKRPDPKDNISWDDFEPLPAEVRKQYVDQRNAEGIDKSQGAADDARNRYDLGTWHRLRGEHAIAIARFREALELDPDLLAARNDLAALLFLRGDYETAEREYQQILERDSHRVSALKGLAVVHAKLRNFHSAAAALEQILIFAPDDAEAWLHLGDARLFMGDRAGAREAWTQAETLESASTEIKDRAQRRLTIYRADGLDLNAAK